MGVKGVIYFDVVCFIVKVLDVCLIVLQKYIFSEIMLLFGKDIKKNICILIIFVDGVDLFVFVFLKEVYLLVGFYF